jgi:hypothetical protein
MIKRMMYKGTGHIVLGFILVVIGWAIPFLTVMKMIEAGFLLLFLSHGMSVGGLFLGLIGAAKYIDVGKKQE